MLNCFNGILRNKEEEHWNMDGENVMLKGFVESHIPPDNEDKPELLEKALTAAQNMNQNDRDIALLLSSSLNAIHPYNDGNGRTSRLLYTLLTQEFNQTTKEELKPILDKYGREKIDIDPSIIGWKIDALIREKTGINDYTKNTEKLFRTFTGFGEKEFDVSIDEKDKKAFQKLLKNDSSLVLICFFKFFKNNPGYNNREYIKMIPNDKDNKTYLDIGPLTKELEETDIKEILAIYRDLKKEEVEILIDCIANPYKEDYKMQVDNETISYLDYFKKGIKEKIRQQILQKNRASLFFYCAISSSIPCYCPPRVLPHLRLSSPPCQL